MPDHVQNQIFSTLFPVKYLIYHRNHSNLFSSFEQVCARVHVNTEDNLFRGREDSI